MMHRPPFYGGFCEKEYKDTERPMIIGLALFGATGTASEKGLVVSKVQPGSSAAQAGFQAGDVVVRVDCQPIHQAADMENAFAGADGPVWVSYLIQGAWLTDKKVTR